MLKKYTFQKYGIFRKNGKNTLFYKTNHNENAKIQSFSEIFLQYIDLWKFKNTLIFAKTLFFTKMSSIIILAYNADYHW